MGYGRNKTNKVIQIGMETIELQNQMNEVIRKTTMNTDEFVATEGQTLFTLTGEYEVGNNRVITVDVGGVKQYSPKNYTETSSNQITLLEGVPQGTEVVISYYLK